METICVRMTLGTFNRIKRSFYPRMDETAAEYFSRLSIYLQEMKISNKEGGY